MRTWTPEQQAGRREATKRWRQRNPDKVAEANRRPRNRPYQAEKAKGWREQRLLNPQYREKLNRQANERATAIRLWIDAYKLSHGCVDCGYKAHPHALHFDHVGDDKMINVCNAKSVGQAEREIAKCEVRCANCHSIKTHDRRQLRKSLGKSHLCTDTFRS